MDLNLLRGVIIILLLLSFFGMGIWLWFYADRNKLDQAARMPLEEDDAPRSMPSSRSVQESAR